MLLFNRSPELFVIPSGTVTRQLWLSVPSSPRPWQALFYLPSVSTNPATTVPRNHILSELSGCSSSLLIPLYTPPPQDPL